MLFSRGDTPAVQFATQDSSSHENKLSYVFMHENGKIMTSDENKVKAVRIISSQVQPGLRIFQVAFSHGTSVESLIAIFHKETPISPLDIQAFQPRLEAFLWKRKYNKLEF